MKNRFLLSIRQNGLNIAQDRRGRGVLMLSTMIVLLTGIIAFASIPGTNGVIYTCYNKNGDGSLRVIDSAQQCKANENSLNFNQTGPAGANGLSEAYTVRQPFEEPIAIAAPSTFTPPTVILSKNVPAGSYVINAKMQVTNFSSGGRNVICNLNTGDVSSVRIDPQTGASKQTIALQDTVNFSSPSTITITCVGSSIIQTLETYIDNSVLTAIKVDAIY
jgi:hypothetical protein